MLGLKGGPGLGLSQFALPWARGPAAASACCCGEGLLWPCHTLPWNCKRTDR